MTKKSGPIYRGRLAEPLEGFPGPPDLAAEAYQQFLKRVGDAYYEKMFLLLDHYKIPHDREDRWNALSLSLARDHVPGFQIAAKKGRKQKWNPLLDAAASIAVDLYIRQYPQHSIASASNKVAKLPWWAEIVGGTKEPGEVIRQAYFRASLESTETAAKLFLHTATRLADAHDAGTVSRETMLQVLRQEARGEQIDEGNPSVAAARQFLQEVKKEGKEIVQMRRKIKKAAPHK